MRLPPQPWLERSGAPPLLDALGVAAGDTRLVGGAVRDALLGLPVADIDFATRLAPEEVVARLEAAGLKAVPTGIAHGTVTAVSHGLVAEVTTLRRDVDTDGRHATIAYTDDWREDAARRDFTINALYADPLSGAIDDWFGGLDDLAARRVRFIGEPLQRIAEDHLRILRFFRFHARFGAGAPDADGLAACAARAADLASLSRERVRDELLKLLCVDDPAPTLATMLGHRILASVFPEIEASRLPALSRLVAIERSGRETCVALRRLATLLAEDAVLLDDVARRLRLSNADRARLVATADRLDRIPADVSALAYRAGVDTARDLVLLAADDGGATTMLAALADWKRPQLPVSGRDLIALGVPQGPEVSRLLAEVESRWIAAGFPDRDATLAIAQSVTSSSRRKSGPLSRSRDR